VDEQLKFPLMNNALRMIERPMLLLSEDVDSLFDLVCGDWLMEQIYTCSFRLVSRCVVFVEINVFIEQWLWGDRQVKFSPTIDCRKALLS
jgi:hypothetical protein